MTASVRLAAFCACPSRPRLEVRADSPAALPRTARCPTCRMEKPLLAERLTGSGGLAGCLACGHEELFTRKRFPPAAGISVVLAAAILAPATNYLSLAAAALVDFVLYHALPDGVVCYVCGSSHRGFRPEPRHPRFDREIAERLRFGPSAVMGKPMRAGGTAGAPDPEH